MRQQVNLYQPIFRKEKKVFSAIAMGQTCLAILAGLTLITFWSMWQERAIRGSIEEFSQQKDSRLQQIADLARRFPVRKKNVLLEQQLASLTTLRDQKRRTLEALTGEAYGNRTGFSGHMTGLARQHVAGLWLSDIQLASGGTSLSLDGSALRAELVPQYLQKLAAEKAYAGREFYVFEMRRSEQSGQWIDFTLNSRPAK